MAINENNTQFNALLEVGELSREGILIYYLDTKKFIHVNAVAHEQFDSRIDYKVGLDEFIKLVFWQDQEFVNEQFQKVITTFSKIEIEFRIRKDDGTNLFVCCNAYLILEKQYLIISLRDISKAKDHENYLIEFGSKKNTMLDTLTHHMSGALTLMHHLTTAAENENSPTLQAGLFGLLKDNNQYCLKIINDLLADEHLKAPNIFLKKIRINVVEKIQFIVDILIASYKDKTFEFIHQSPVIFCKTDEFKLLQIVNNLTSNAVKFTPAHATVRIILEERSDEILVSVSDNGIGIPPAIQMHLFEKSFLTGRTGLKGERSTGIGLTISKTLTESMGGKLWFESTENKGSTFSLSIPKN